MDCGLRPDGVLGGLCADDGSAIGPALVEAELDIPLVDLKTTAQEEERDLWRRRLPGDPP